MRQAFRRTAAVAAVLSWASSALACPLCRSEAGERVRAGLFGPDFGYHLAVTLLPFPVFLGVVALIHFGPPRGGRHPRKGEGADPPPAVGRTPPPIED